ncbi:MAG: hypothetical protein U0H95_01650 [Lachnospira sp.]|jgi:hypothetical protein|nr:hypothetical protein [Lachnospira sp.]
MRVISQDGSIDVSYEMAVVYVECEGVIAKVGDKKYVMGSYSTEKKAVKAMEMLREHNEGVIFLKTIINTEKGTPFVSGLSKTDFNKLTQNYFQFPQDNEIEV